MDRRTVYVVGNLLVKKDSLPIRLIPFLRKECPKIDFVEFDPSEDFLPDKKVVTIIDTVINIDRVQVFTDIDKIELSKAFSLHDFDLGYNLRLMKKFNMLDKVNIIGIPDAIDEKSAISQILSIISNLFSESE